jgi:acetyl esterase
LADSHSAARAPLHPQAKSVIAARNARPAADLEAMRERYTWCAERFGLQGADVHRVEDLLVARPPAQGGHVPVRLYWPRPEDDNGACLVWLHGGAWVVGSAGAADPVARGLCHAAGCRVVAVDYRLAPEHPFPAGLEDALTVSEWATAGGADVLGHRRDRVAVGGDSAGGNLAAVAARRLRDGGTEPRLGAQILVYPVTDAGMTTASHAQPAATITAEAMRACWSLYLGGATPDASNPDMSPLAADLHHLPPTLMILAGHDLLHDEGRDYAEALRNVGGEVEVIEYPELPHGFLDWAGAIEPAAAAFQVVGQFLRRTVGRPQAS